jgi:AcrR family transcriptional regulator
MAGVTAGRLGRQRRRGYLPGMAAQRTATDVDGTPDARRRIAAAARELFAAQGYDRTTVEAIAERAGVARRTFFRHFRSKDDVIFPDHERIEGITAAHLAALDDVPPVRAVCSGAKLIFRTYVDDPAVSVQRYALSRSVPALRDREIASISRYNRLFSRYLRRRLGEAPGVRLYADVVAAAVVAAHNEVLRAWLLAGGADDPLPSLDRALAWVAERFEQAVPAASGEPDEDVVVAVFRAGAPLDDVVKRISRSL